MSRKQRIIDLIEADEMRMRALRAARSFDLPDWLIAAGFVRNLIWNSLFGGGSPLADIDLIYFCPSNLASEIDSMLEEKLFALEPNFPWSVKNQARMHSRNGDTAYQNTLNAMQYWPEKQTAIGAMLNDNDNIVLQHCFDLSFQFNGQINRNPVRSTEVFIERVARKGWLNTWPNLQVRL